MGLILGLIIPLILILLPLLCQVYFCKRAIKKHSLNMLLIVGISTILLGLCTPILATLVSIKGLTYNTSESNQCVQGVETFLIFGYLISLFVSPLIFIDTYRTYKSNH